MNTAEYKKMSERESTYWWHVGRYKILETYLGIAAKNKKKPIILNVGCGTGGTISTLEKFGEVHNVDTSDIAIGFIKKLGYDRVTKIDGKILPFKDRSFDIIGAFDVLEHIEKQIPALKEWSRVLKDDGSIVLSIPAYQWLWSGHDVSLQHKRRYVRHDLIKIADELGLSISKVSYAFFFSLPLIIVFRLRSRLLKHKVTSETSYVDVPNWLNNLFIGLLRAEAKVHKLLYIPCGTSLVVIFTKKRRQNRKNR